MKISILILLAVIGWAIIMTGCKIFQAKKTGKDLPEVLASHAYGGCFGKCAEFELTIFENGEMEYLGIENVKMEGLHTAKISDEIILELKAKFAEVRFAEMEDEYLSNIADLPTISLEYRGKACDFHQRKAPKSLTPLLKFLEALIEGSQWSTT